MLDAREGLPTVKWRNFASYFQVTIVEKDKERGAEVLLLFGIAATEPHKN